MLRIPVGVRRILRHVPVQIRRAVVPPRRAALAEPSLDLVHGLVRSAFSLTVGFLLGIAYRPPGRHQPADEFSSLSLIETGVRHAPQPAADDEVPTVRRHRMLHDMLGRLPLRFGRRLLRSGLLRRLLAGDRHQHFLLTACHLAGLLGRL